MLCDFFDNLKLTKNDSNNSNTENKISYKEYENLEKLVQKYEKEIREHIATEQKLKIYIENIEEKLTNCEKKVRKYLDKKDYHINKIDLDNNDIMDIKNQEKGNLLSKPKKSKNSNLFKEISKNDPKKEFTNQNVNNTSKLNQDPKDEKKASKKKKNKNLKKIKNIYKNVIKKPDNKTINSQLWKLKKKNK